MGVRRCGDVKEGEIIFIICFICRYYGRNRVIYIVISYEILVSGNVINKESLRWN